jgi:beta-phosphoglucomutase
MASCCVIFDFDGVIADTETLHLAGYNYAFASSAALLGGPFAVSRDSYFHRYIAYSDREAFEHMLRDAGLPHGPALVSSLCGVKTQWFAQNLQWFAEPLPGVRKILAWLEERNIPRAICSGAQRKEIEHLLDGFALRSHFALIVASEEVHAGKPDPEGYNLAFERLQKIRGGALRRETSLVIEDSAGGCAAAKAAGLRVLGVATSLPLEKVAACADFAVRDLGELDLAALNQWLSVEER